MLGRMVRWSCVQRLRLGHLEAMGIRIAVVDKDRIVACHAGPSTDRRNDARHVADAGLLLYAAAKDRADDALVDKFAPFLELPASANCAMRADVPVPHGERSIAWSP